MILERSMHPQYLSNTYLVGEPGGAAFFVDAGGPVSPLIAAAERHGMTPTHVLLTHHHHDHVVELAELLERWPDMQVLIHPAERDVDGVTGDLDPGETCGSAAADRGAAHARATPRACSRCSSRARVHRRHAVQELGRRRARARAHHLRRPEGLDHGHAAALPPETVIRPGHTDPTTVAEEWETNAFVRVWRGLDPEGDEPCTAMGEPATLVLLGDDYDGGHKAWVRWPDGRDDIVPGSQVKRQG